MCKFTVIPLDTCTSHKSAQKNKRITPSSNTTSMHGVKGPIQCQTPGETFCRQCQLPTWLSLSKQAMKGCVCVREGVANLLWFCLGAKFNISSTRYGKGKAEKPTVWHVQTVKWINPFTSTLLNWVPKGIITQHSWLVDTISRSQIFRRNLPITNAEIPSWKAMLPAVLVIFSVENFLFMFFGRNVALPLFLTVAVFAAHPAMEVHLLIQTQRRTAGQATRV